MSIKVLNPGLLTTVQDLGRPGHYHLGIPTSGAMDRFALRAANMLVGNDEGAACLEAVFMGPELEFTAPAIVAVTGLPRQFKNFPIGTRAIEVYPRIQGDTNKGTAGWDSYFHTFGHATRQTGGKFFGRLGNDRGSVSGQRVTVHGGDKDRIRFDAGVRHF